MEEEEEDNNNMIMWKYSTSSSSSLSESDSMVSATVGRVMTTLLTSRPKKLQNAVSRLHSPPQLAPLGVSLEQSLWFLHNYVKDAAEKESSLDQVLVPMIEHSLKCKESKHGDQSMILLNWLFQDEILFQALVTNLASIILRKDDHYIALGWCTLARGLIEYEITLTKFVTNGIREKYNALLKILCSRMTYLLSIACGTSVLQGGFELPTRLSMAAADFILALTVALTRKDAVSNISVDNRQKLSHSNAPNLPIMRAVISEKKVKPISGSPEVADKMDTKLLLWDHLDELINLVQRLLAWSKKSRPLHVKGLERVLKWLQGTKQQYGCFQKEAGSEMLNTGVLLLSSCWKHYGMLMHLEDYKFSQHFNVLLDQYLSGIQFYADNYTEEQTETKDSGTETIKFFLNCLSLLLGRMNCKQFESAMTEYGPKISQVLISQLRCADEDVIDGAVCMFKAAIFKTNRPLDRSSLTDIRQMEDVLPLLLQLLNERDGAAKAVVMLVAEYCSISSDNMWLKEVLNHLASGDVSQRRNGVDLISELLHKSLDSANIFSHLMWQDMANHLLECLEDEESEIQVQASNLIPLIDPSFVLLPLVRLIYSSHERIQSSASNTLVAVLKWHNKKPEVICSLLDCVSDLWQTLDLPEAVGGRGEGSKLDTDRVLKLIPEWSKTVKDWKLMSGPLIDKMFAEPSNAIIVRFLGYINEHLAEAADVVFHQLLLHARGQKEIDESSFSKWESKTYTNEDAMKLEHCLFYRLCPLLIIRLLPLRVFSDLNCSLIYGDLLNQHTMHDDEYFNFDDNQCVAALLMNRAFSKFEFEDVRKLAAELCGRIHPHILFPLVSSQLEHAANTQDVLKLKACLFAICTSLVVRGRDAILPPVMLRIRRTMEIVLSWPSIDGDEVSKAQHGCIDCLALMVCAELQAPDSVKASALKRTSIDGEANCSGNVFASQSVLTYVIHKLTSDKNEVSPFTLESCTSEATVLSFRLCMANVLISTSQKISDSGKKSFAQKILPCLIHSVEQHVIKDSEIRAACVQVLFSAVYHLKSAVLPYSSELASVSLKSLREGSEKERMSSAKLLASLMASEEKVVESISSVLLEARTLLSSICLSDPSPDVRKVCKKLLACLTSL